MRALVLYPAVLAVAGINIVIAARHVSHAALVDGWAAWNRFILLSVDGASFVDYLLGFFGAHPHSIVMLLVWLDMKLADGDQSILAAANYLAILAFVLFCVHRHRAWARKRGIPGWAVLTSGMAIAALLTTLADPQVMTLPFQSVLPVSRLAYVLLLWGLIRALHDEDRHLRLAVTVAACVAVTFHGAGPLFALLFLLVHALHYRNAARLLEGLAPFAFVVLHAFFYKNGGELDNLPSLLAADKLALLGRSVLSYFAVPVAVYQRSLGAPATALIGALLLCFTVAVALRSFHYVLMLRLRRTGERPDHEEFVFAGVICLFVLLSALSASALMTIRSGIAAPEITLGTTRYAAYAVLSCVLLVCASSAMAADARIRMRSGAVVGAMLGLCGIAPALTFSEDFRHDVELNVATAALSVGISPLHPPADTIWPQAETDWYWKDALPFTVRHLVAERRGPWSHLPALGERETGRVVPIMSPQRIAETTTCRGTVLRFTGTVDDAGAPRFSRSDVRAVVDAAHRIIGYAATDSPDGPSNRRVVQGFLIAEGTGDLDVAALFLATDEGGGRRDRTATGTGPRDVGTHVSFVPQNVSDATWTHGVANRFAAFFLEDSPEGRRMMGAGSLVRFADGSVRKIQQQVIANGYLNIYVDGMPLDGDVVGHPNRVQVLGDCPVASASVHTR